MTISESTAPRSADPGAAADAGHGAPADAPSGRTLTLALAQIPVSEDAEAVLAAVAAAAQDAASAGAQLLVLPEATLTPFGTDLRAAAVAHAAQFEAHLERLGEEHGIVLIAGSFAPAEGARVVNRLLVRGRAADGAAVRAHYDKIHLFDAFGQAESETVAPGSALVTFDLPLGDGSSVRLGLATCYDIRFPEQFVALAGRGAEVLVIPTSWASGPGKAEQLRLLQRARALDTTCVLVCCDQVPAAGYEGGAARGVGGSAVVSPLGEVLAAAGEGPQLLLASVDLDTVARARASLPVLAGRGLPTVEA